MPQDESVRRGEHIYPPFLAPPDQPLSLPAYFLAFVRNPLAATPAVIYREWTYTYRNRITYVADPARIKRILLDDFTEFPKTIIERYGEVLDPDRRDGAPAAHRAASEA